MSLIIIPVIIFYFIAQKHIIKPIAVGNIKLKTKKYANLSIKHTFHLIFYP